MYFIIIMSKFDHLDFSGRNLQLFLAVFDEGSVTKAAERLNIGQSAVSHMLDKLRVITGDPLFVRAGRGIVATQRAEQLAQQVRPLLASLQQLTEKPAFDPFTLEGTASIGASAMQREFLVPHLAQILRIEAPRLAIKVTNSSPPCAENLRKGDCDLIITPEPPIGTEFVQQKLFESEWACFFDPSAEPPLSLDHYLARPHAKVIFSKDEKSVIDVLLDDMGLKRRIALRVESFSALTSLMRGTDLVIALPRMISVGFLQGFSSCPLPFDVSPLSFYAVWHLGQNSSPYNQWLRDRLKKVVSDLKL